MGTVSFVAFISAVVEVIANAFHAGAASVITSKLMRLTYYNAISHDKLFRHYSNRIVKTEVIEFVGRDGLQELT